MAIFVPTVTPTLTPLPTPTAMPPIVIPVMPILHSPIIAGFDIRQIIGLGGVTFIEAFVKYLQNQWKFPMKGMMPALMSIICGILLNMGVAWYLQMDMTNALIMGIITGVSASGYHEYSK